MANYVLGHIRSHIYQHGIKKKKEKIVQVYPKFYIYANL